MSEITVSIELFHLKCPPHQQIHNTTYNPCILYTWRRIRKTLRDFFFFPSEFYKYEICSYHRFEYLQLMISFFFIFTLFIQRKHYGFSLAYLNSEDSSRVFLDHYKVR